MFQDWGNVQKCSKSIHKLYELCKASCLGTCSSYISYLALVRTSARETKEERKLKLGYQDDDTVVEYIFISCIYIFYW